MPDAASIRRVALLTLLFLGVRIATAAVVSQPGYTDAYYFTDVAARLARGEGLTADFIWSPIEAGSLALPVPSHLFWVPMATVLGASGIASFGWVLGDFRAGQLAIVLVAASLPAITYAAARTLGSRDPFALAAAAVVGLGGLFAPGLVDVDAFAPAALIGTSFFIAFGRAARGSVRMGAVAGILVGLLYLSRSEGALFGAALLALLFVPRARAAGAVGAAAALAIGAGWLVRDLTVGAGTDLFARSALLTRYEDFFAFAPSYASGSLGDAIGVRAAALATNALTFAFAFALILLVPLAVCARRLVGRAEVRAWIALLLVVYLAQSLVWTLHSTRGSYFHSLAAFFPFGVAMAAHGAGSLLGSRPPGVSRMWIAGALVLVAVMSAGAVIGWDASFNVAARARADAVAAIPAGPFLAIDAAAWRWLSGHPVAVTPADGIASAACVARRLDAQSLVLEASHFSRYDALYTGDTRPSWLDAPVTIGTTKIYRIVAPPPCAAP